MNVIKKLLIFFILLPIFNCNIILKPLAERDFQVGFIFLQAANVPANNYTYFANAIQSKFNGSLWVALVDFPYYIPEPLIVDSIMDTVYSDLRSAGFKFAKNTPFFLGGQALGGSIIQNYMLETGKIFPFNFAGLILNGNFIQRVNIDQVKNSNFPLVLTIGGELDGLCRITRIAESFHHDKIQNNNVKNRSLTLVIEGMSHYQFWGQGIKPSYIIKNDLQPEISDTVARDLLTTINIAFMHSTLGIETNQDLQILQSYYNSTSYLVAPIIDAFKQEGFYHFSPPCYMQSSSNCSIGSLWSVFAQGYMGSIGLMNENITDTFIQIFSIPEKFPTITNCSCTGTPCIVNIGALTENSYSSFDNLDSGFYPVAAIEAKTKMNSRQSVLQRYTGKSFDFNTTDAKSLCKEINQLSIEWAVEKILAKSPKTITRYQTKGKFIIPGEDIGPESTGSQWVSAQLAFNEKIDIVSNRTYFEVRSPTLRTPTNYPISFVAGYHYCKLLTPARAAEFIFVDSLKP